MKTAGVYTSVYLSTETAQRLAALARQSNRSRSNVLRQLLTLAQVDELGNLTLKDAATSARRHA